MNPILRQLSIATFGHGVEKVVALIVATVLFHRIDKTLMGQFFFAMGVCYAAALINEFGTSRYLIRNIAPDHASAAMYLGSVLRLRLSLLALSIITINGVVFVTAPHLLHIFLFTSIHVLFESLFHAFSSTLLGLGAIGTRVLTGLVGPLLLLTLVPAAAVLGWPLERIVVLYAISTSAMALVGFLAVLRRVDARMLFRGGIPARSIAAQCSLLFAVNVIVLLQSRIDEWMLAALRDFREVAGYAAAYKLAEASRSVVRPATMVLLPLFAAAAGRGDWLQIREHARRTLWITAAAGFAVGGVVIVLAPWLVPLLFGSEYPETVAITRVLFLATPALFIVYIATLINNSLHLDKELLMLAIASMALSLVADYVAISRWGALGAAWSTLGTETLLASGMILLPRYILSRKITPGAPPPAPTST